MAPITINRTPWGALIDDSGGNLDGTPWTKDQIKVVLLDQIDAALAKIPVDATGIISQIKFPATQVPSTDPNVLDDYEEGTWTPIDASGAGLVFTAVAGVYVKIGSLVHAAATLTFPTTSNGAGTQIGGFPFPFPVAGNIASGAIGYTSAGALHTILGFAGASYFSVYNTAGAPVPNNTFSAKPFVFSFSYRTAT